MTKNSSITEIPKESQKNKREVIKAQEDGRTKTDKTDEIAGN